MSQPTEGELISSELKRSNNPGAFGEFNPFMQQALNLTKKAILNGDVPVGAVVVHNGIIIGSGWNRREELNKVAAHAEMLAIDEACSGLGSWRLNECDIYVTLEPCPMCASAIIQSRMRSLYFGAWDPKAGAAGSATNLFMEGLASHQVIIYEGIMEAACRSVLDTFFARLRKQG